MNLTVLAISIGLTQMLFGPFDTFKQPVSPQLYGGYPAGRSVYGRVNMMSPLSGSVLVAQALRSGQLRLPYRPFGPQAIGLLTCTPTPCVTPNVQASEGGSPVNETPITVNPNNARHLLSGGNDYNCSSVQGFYASINGGSTWNHTCMNTLPGTFGDGDPGVAYDLNNNLYITGIDGSGSQNVIAIEKSSNDGQTWSAPATAVVGIGSFLFVDKDWMQIDTTPTSPHANNIYISTTDFDASSNSLMAVARSTDGGVTWHNAQVDAATYPIVDQFTDLAVGSDGTVYLTWMRCSATGPTGDCGGTRSMIMFSKSTDGGVTWSAPVLVDNANLAPDSCGAFYGCLPNTSERVSNVPAVDVDRSSRRRSGRLYVTFYNWTGSRLQVVVAHSGNGGATWSRKVVVSPGAPNDEFFPWLSTNANGVVGVTWLDRRLDPSNLKYDAFASTSTDGGMTFASAVRISSVSSNPLNDGFGGSFMGDYTGDIWARNTLYQSYTDTRTNVGQDEVGGYRI